MSRLRLSIVLAFLVAVGVGVVAVGFDAQPAYSAAANNWTVDTTADTVDATIDGVCADASGDCSLRAAIQEANASAGDDAIFLRGGENGRYMLAITGGALDDASSGDLDITDTVDAISIIGRGASLSVVDASGLAPRERVFHVLPDAELRLDRITVTGGDTGGGVGGGGIRNEGTLTVVDSVVSDNDGTGEGGGIFNDGTTTISASIIRDNALTAGPGNGGGILNKPNATLTIVDSSVSGNDAGFPAGTGLGGGINNGGGATVTIIRSTLDANFAPVRGGGVHNAGTLTVVDSHITENSATFGGGVNQTTPDADSTFVESVVADNSATSRGGGIRADGGTVELVASTVTGNEAKSATISGGEGGGLYNSGATITIVDATVVDNIAEVVFGNPGTGPDCFGEVTVAGSGEVGDVSGCTLVGAGGTLVGDTGGFLGDVGVGTLIPSVPLHVEKDDGTAKVLVKDTSSGLFQNMFELEKDGNPIFRFTDTNLSESWDFRITNTGGFSATRVGTGGTEFQVGANGSLKVGPGGFAAFTVSPGGNTVVAGNLAVNGTCTGCDSLAQADTADRLADLEAENQTLRALVEELATRVEALEGG